MGMYDTLCFKCPACNKITTEQSKAGDCLLASYSLDNAPLEILTNINAFSKKGELYCEHCETQLELEIRFVAIPVIKEPKQEKTPWRTV